MRPTLLARIGRRLRWGASLFLLVTIGARAQPLELSRATIPQLQAAMDAGVLSAEQLVQAYLDRIAAYDQVGPQINAVLAVNPNALARARALDAERQRQGSRGPLHGIPFVLKDNIDTAELPTTGGSFVLDGSQPTEDAPVVARLRAAGAILLAKVNLDDFAAGGSGFSSLGGQTRNPFDPRYTPLGSSGGSGAAVAAWFAPLALGTDTGGSLRSPTSVSGIYGLKPTRGLLSRAGIIPTCYTFDAVGPMARSLEDLAAMLGPMTGYEPGDEDTRASIGLAQPDYSIFLQGESLAGVRIGVMRQGTGSDPVVDALFDAAVERLRALGAEVVDPVEYPRQVVDGGARRGVVKAVCDTEKAIYFDEYLGRLAPQYPHTLAELAERGLALTEATERYGLHPVIYRGLRNRVTTGQGMHSLAYRSAKEHGIAMIQTGVLGVFEAGRFDALVYPTRPWRPHLIDPQEPIDGRGVPPPRPGTTKPAIGLTNIANITGFPDLVVPIGLTPDEGLPVSMSFFGPAFSEPRLLSIAYRFDRAGAGLNLPRSTPPLAGETFGQ